MTAYDRPAEALPAPRTDLKPNTADFERLPFIKPTGFREYDARWLFPQEINLMGMQVIGIALVTLMRERGVPPRIATGHDFRSYSSSIKYALMSGMLAGGAEVRAHWYGRGHTSGDAIIFFPDLKVIHTGDLFLSTGAARAGARTFPPGSNLFVDSSQGGSLMEWTKTLDGALSLDFDAVIPGHGPTTTIGAERPHLDEWIARGW